MAMNKWFKRLAESEDAVIDDYNPHEHVVKTASPSVNFMFGKGHGLPLGLTLALGGYPKGGKTLLCNMFAGQIHADYPEAGVIKFDSEYRTRGQGTAEERERIWGIDRDRYLVFENNNPMKIFDKIEKDVAAQIQDGMDVKLVIIDSVNSIQGRRAMNADTVETQQIGDDAKTLGDGFKRILAVQRKYNFALIFTCQIRAEMDMLEQKRGNKVKMSLPFALQHYAEYFAFIEPNRNKEGRTDLQGHEYKNDSLGDMSKDGAEQTGHKIKLKMKDSSCGPKGRSAEFTLDYRKGLVNVWEEVFTLGKNRGVIDLNGQTYSFRDQTWRGKEKCWEALKADPALQQAIIDELFKRDGVGAFDAQDKVDGEKVDAE